VISCSSGLLPPPERNLVDQIEISDPCDDETNIDHHVTVIGFNLADEYWIIRNSEFVDDCIDVRPVGPERNRNLLDFICISDRRNLFPCQFEPPSRNLKSCLIG